MNERIGYPELLKNPVELSKEYEEVSLDVMQLFQKIDINFIIASSHTILLRTIVYKVYCD